MKQCRQRSGRRDEKNCSKVQQKAAERFKAMRDELDAGQKRISQLQQELKRLEAAAVTAEAAKKQMEAWYIEKAELQKELLALEQDRAQVRSIVARQADALASDAPGGVGRRAGAEEPRE